MQWLIPSLALIVVLWTLVPLLRHDAWWIRLFDFPRVQIAVGTGAVLVAHLAAGPRGAAGWTVGLALLAALIYQLVRIAPYTPLHSKQAMDAAAAHGELLGILVANVLTPNRNAEKLLDIVASRDPDLLLFIETDAWWQSRLDGLEGRYPYSVKCPQDNLYGMLLYSKCPLADPEIEFLVEEDVPSIRAELTLASGQRIGIHAVHPAPPGPTENPSSAERDAELLIVAKTVAQSERPTIVFGDLNDVAWSATTALFQKISRLLDPRIGRGMLSTFHAKYPGVRWPLDHIFFSSDFTLARFERLPAFGSDHFPIYAELCYAPAAEAAHEEPSPDAEDRRDAEERIDKVDA